MMEGQSRAGFRVTGGYTDTKRLDQQGAAEMGMSIDSVGPDGNFLVADHTVKHFRNFWDPTYFTRPAMGMEFGPDFMTTLNEKL